MLEGGGNSDASQLTRQTVPGIRSRHRERTLTESREYSHTKLHKTQWLTIHSNYQRTLTVLITPQSITNSHN